MKTGFFKVEALGANGHQRGLVYLNDRAKAEWLASEWRKFASVFVVTVSEDEA